MDTTTNGLIQFKNLCSFNQFSSSLACIPSQDRCFCKGLKIKHKTRWLSLNPKCQVVDEIGSRASSLSALELLKTSAADRYTKESSSVLVIGINFRTAPVEIRERL